MRIVPYQPRHATAWRDLNAAWISRYFTLEPKDREVLDDPQGKILDQGGYIFMAEDEPDGDGEGRPIGCVALIPMADGGFELAKMTVTEASRGTGLGRALMEACINKAIELDAPRLYLETNSSLAPALSLYQSVGFVQLPPADTPYARCDVWMERRL